MGAQNFNSAPKFSPPNKMSNFVTRNFQTKKQAKVQVRAGQLPHPLARSVSMLPIELSTQNQIYTFEP